MADSPPSSPSETGHVVDQVLGGGAAIAPKVRKPKPRRVHLRMVDAPAAFEPRPGLPAGGRDECREGERPCPYIRCKFHLWLVLPEDRRGRRGGRKEGEPIGPVGDRERRISTTVLPAWLEYPTPPCCALDFAESVDAGDPLLVSRIAQALHLSRSRTFAIIAAVTEKLRARRKEMARLELVDA